MESPAPLEALRANVESVVIGKPAAVRMALVSLLAEGHLLVEDVPGVGKTLLAKALARSLDCRFHRVQFTPDLLPSDLIGSNVFRPQDGSFEFHPGPLFADVVLADEINRATPRTQSALLEAMSDRQVSVDGKTHRLGPLFLVLATQNPYEFEGTYPLPESQLDRFLLRVTVGYPDKAAELEILTRHRAGEPVDELSPVLKVDDVLAAQEEARRVKVDGGVGDYILELVRATREHAAVSVGASTRAALGLYRACQAWALLAGRDFVVPDDVKELAVPALAHRVLTKRFGGPDAGGHAAAVIGELLDSLPVPQ